MSWLKQLFVKRKTLDEVRDWVAHCNDQAVQPVRTLLVKIDTYALQRSEKQSELDRLTRAKEELEEQRAEIIQQKETFLATPDYQQLKNHLLLVVQARKNIEEEIKNLFAPLQEVLTHYTSLGHQKLHAYTQNCVDALIHDYDLHIVKHVPAIITSITQATISTDNAQRTIGLLNELKTDKLSKLIHAYALARKTEEKEKLALTTNTLVRKHEQLIQAIDKIQQDIHSLNEQIATIILPSDEELRKELRTLLEPHRIILI